MSSDESRKGGTDKAAAAAAAAAAASSLELASSGGGGGGGGFILDPGEGIPLIDREEDDDDEQGEECSSLETASEDVESRKELVLSVKALASSPPQTKSASLVATNHRELQPSPSPEAMGPLLLQQHQFQHRHQHQCEQGKPETSMDLALCSAKGFYNKAFGKRQPKGDGKEEFVELSEDPPSKEALLVFP